MLIDTALLRQVIRQVPLAVSNDEVLSRLLGANSARLRPDQVANEEVVRKVEALWQTLVSRK